MEKPEDLDQNVSEREGNNDGHPDRRDHVAPDGAVQDSDIQSPGMARGIEYQEARNVLPVDQLPQQHPNGTEQTEPQLMQPQTQHLNMGGGPIRTPTAPYKQPLLELMQFLRSHRTPEQEQRILQILKSNPDMLHERAQRGFRGQAMTSQHGDQFKQPHFGYNFFAERLRRIMQNQTQTLSSVSSPQGVMDPSPNVHPVLAHLMRILELWSAPARSPQPNSSSSDQQPQGLLSSLCDPAAIVEEVNGEATVGATNQATSAHSSTDEQSPGADQDETCSANS